MASSNEVAVNLSNMKLRVIPEEVLRRCYNITSLDLSMNRGILVNGSLKQFSHLRRLLMNNCKLRDIPWEISELAELEELELSGNRFSSGLSTVIGRLARLKKLNLSGCGLTDLSESFGNLKQLEELDLSDNNFSGGFPIAIGQLVRLKSLDLSQSCVAALTENIENLDQLQYLNLSDNDLQEYPLCTLRLRNLKTLDLSAESSSSSLSESDDDFDESGGDLHGCSPTFAEDDDNPGVNADLLKSLTNYNKLAYQILFKSDGNFDESDGDGHGFNQKFDEYENNVGIVADLRNSAANYTRHDYQPRGMGIKQLPIELAYTSLERLNLEGNPIEEPPQAIWTQGIEAIKSFMRAIIPGGTLMHADTLNMIGDTGAGKTSLAQSLIARCPRPTAEANRTQVLHQHALKIDEKAGHSVNINDFGGHNIYHSVIPIFLPANGLVILVFDLSDVERAEHIKKWLLTAIAKTSEIRLIIVGTHADKIDQQRTEIEIQLMTFLVECLDKAAHEVSAHINHLNSQSDGTRVKLKKLRDVHSNLQNALFDFLQSAIGEVQAHISSVTSRPHNEHANLDNMRRLLAKLQTVAEKTTMQNTNAARFVTLSCLVTDEGLDKLRQLVANLLRPPQTLPIHWCKAILDIQKQSDYLYITMERVIDICRVHFTASDDGEALKIILRYLTKTSQIIWLEHHPVLRDYIFHSPQRIIDTCKKMLYHDSKALVNLKDVFERELEAYDKGILLVPLLKELLSTHVESHTHSGEQTEPIYQLSTSASVVLDFMEQFNLMSHVRTENGYKEFIVPCNLAPAAPSKLEQVEHLGVKCLNRVIIRLSFIGSIIPMSLFETSLSLILTVAGKLPGYRTRPDVWKDGVIILHDGVYFIAKRLDSVITFIAFSKPENPSPWTVLHPVLKSLSENVSASWHGAPPHCAVVCPSCARRSQLDNCMSPVGEIPEELTRLASIYGQGQIRPMCGEICLTTIPQSLCYATEINGSFTNDQLHLEEFFRDIGVQGSKVNNQRMRWAAVSDNDARHALRKSFDTLTSHLNCTEVKDILHRMEVLSFDELEQITSHRFPRKKRESLLHAVRTRGQRGLKAFTDALLETRQVELYRLLIENLREIVPKAFEKEATKGSQ